MSSSFFGNKKSLIPKSAIGIIIYAISIIGCDQLSKAVFIQGRTFNIGPIVLAATKNAQGVFGANISNSFALFFSLIAIIALIYAKKYVNSPWEKQVIFLVIIAGISNLVDRVVRGGVVDIISYANLNLNIADMVIISGVGYFLVRSAAKIVASSKASAR